METSILHARVDTGMAQRVAMLAAMRKIKQQDVIKAGVQRELDAAPELPEIERFLSDSNTNDQAGPLMAQQQEQ